MNKRNLEKVEKLLIQLGVEKKTESYIAQQKINQEKYMSISSSLIKSKDSQSKGGILSKLSNLLGFSSSRPS